MGILCRSSTSLRVTTLPFARLLWTPGASRFSQSLLPRSHSSSRSRTYRQGTHRIRGPRSRGQQAVHVLIAISRPRQRPLQSSATGRSNRPHSTPSYCIEYSTLAVSAALTNYFIKIGHLTVNRVLNFHDDYRAVHSAPIKHAVPKSTKAGAATRTDWTAHDQISHRWPAVL